MKLHLSDARRGTLQEARRQLSVFEGAMKLLTSGEPAEARPILDTARQTPVADYSGSQRE